MNQEYKQRQMLAKIIKELEQRMKYSTLSLIVGFFLLFVLIIAVITGIPLHEFLWLLIIGNAFCLLGLWIMIKA